MKVLRTHAIPVTMLLVVLAAASRAQAQPAGTPKAPASFTVISPIYGQLVRFSMPSDFVAMFEKTNTGSYVREAVLKGETVEQWTQMITVTGAKGVAANKQVTPESFAASIAAGFRKACPASFDA